MKEQHELFIMLPSVLEYEALERCIPFSPARVSGAGQLRDVVEIRGCGGVTDRVGPLQVSGQPECDPNLVLDEGVVCLDAAQRSHQVRVGGGCRFESREA